MSGDHSITTNYNKDILTLELGLKQFSNTTVFTKHNFFVLSPSVQNSAFWFDLRKVNLDRFNTRTQRGYLLIRYFEKFLIVDLADFMDRMIDKERYVETSNSGVHWKFNIQKNTNNYIIINRSTKRSFDVKEIETEELKKLFI